MSSMGALAAPPPQSERPPWNSPVPYLYGGLAAMAALVVIALLIIACSYWKLYGYLHNSERDLEAGQAEEREGGAKTAPPVLEEKYLVIMAGQKNPTFVATPRSSRDSSFGSSTCSSTSSCESSSLEEEEKKIESGRHIEMGNMETP